MMMQPKHSFHSIYDFARAIFLGVSFVIVTLAMSSAWACEFKPENAREPASSTNANRPSIKSSSRAKTNFVNTCERKIKANVRGKKDRANLICTCIVNNLSKKVDDSRIEIITKSYQGRIDMTKLRKTHPDIDITFEFEMDVAESCLEDVKYEIGVEG